MWLFEQPRVCRCEMHSKSVVSLVWVLLGHGFCMCSVWFCTDFLDFSTSIFFSDFFLWAFVWGPIMSPKHLSRGWGNALLAEKTPYKGNPCQGKRAVLKHFRLKQWFLVFLIYFHRPGPLSKPKNQVFIRCGCLSSQGLQMRNSLKICCLLGLGPSWAGLLHV